MSYHAGKDNSYIVSGKPTLTGLCLFGVKFLGLNCLIWILSGHKTFLSFNMGMSHKGLDIKHNFGQKAFNVIFFFKISRLKGLILKN